MGKKLLIVTSLCLIILISTNFIYFQYFFSQQVVSSELSVGVCERVIESGNDYNCPQFTFLITSQTQFNDTVNLLHPERDKDQPELDFSQNSIIFVYINLLNGGWEFNIVGISETDTNLVVHILKQNMREVEFKVILQFYFLLKIPKIEKPIEVNEVVQNRAISWASNISQFLSILLIGIVIMQTLREIYWKKFGKNEY